MRRQPHWQTFEPKRASAARLVIAVVIERLDSTGARQQRRPQQQTNEPATGWRKLDSSLHAVHHLISAWRRLSDALASRKRTHAHK